MNNLIIETGKKGFLTLKYQGRYLHSAIDPVKEAERFLPPRFDGSLYLVLGAGLGYHIRLLLEQIPAQSFVFVFEEKQEIIDAFKEHSGIADPRVKIFRNDRFFQFMDEFKRTVPFHQIQNPLYMELKSETLAFPQEYAKIRRNVQEFFSYYLQSLFTEAEFSVLWYKNMILNSPRIFNPTLSLYLEGGAALAAAGPSLPRSFNLLRNLQGKVPIFAVDTALKPLMEAGIIPDVVVAADSQIHNFRDFFHLPGLENMILACDVSVYHEIPGLFRHVYFFKTEELGDAIFQEMNRRENIRIPVFPGGGSVSSSALTLLYHLGAREVILAGQDLCYPHLTHSRGSIHVDRALYTSSKTRPLWNFFQTIIQKRGYQDLFMKNLARWIEDFIRLSGMKIYQAHPEAPIASAIKDIPENLTGKLYTFQKPLNRHRERGRVFRDDFFSLLLHLRKAASASEFMEIREKSPFSAALKSLFIRQDLYLNRKSGQETLFLGGCFRIIDRLIRAMELLRIQEGRSF